MMNDIDCRRAKEQPVPMKIGESNLRKIHTQLITRRMLIGENMMPYLNNMTV
jgi:hypothetical protein